MSCTVDSVLIVISGFEEASSFPYKFGICFCLVLSKALSCFLFISRMFNIFITSFTLMSKHWCSLSILPRLCYRSQKFYGWPHDYSFSFAAITHVVTAVSNIFHNSLTWHVCFILWFLVEIKELLSIVLRDLSFSTAVVHQVNVKLVALHFWPSVFYMDST